MPLAFVVIIMQDVNEQYYLRLSYGRHAKFDEAKRKTAVRIVIPDCMEQDPGYGSRA